MGNFRQLMVLLLFVLLLSAARASAQSCSDSAVPLNFSTYTGTLLYSVGTVTITCKGNSNYKISLDAGIGVGATTAIRKMTGPAGATLNYQMFQDSARTMNWGNNSGVDTVSGTGNGSAQPYSIYGQVLAGQSVAPGTYTDTVAASITASGSSGIVNFTVTAIVQTGCLITATNMAFGNYAGVEAASTSVVLITCTSGTSYNVGLNAGTAPGATVTSRSMTGPASSQLRYQLFRDAGRTMNWGNTVGVDTVVGAGTGTAQPLNVYGRIPAGQLVRPGSYADTISATITY